MPIVTGSGNLYSVAVSGMTSSGAVVMSVSGGAAVDAAGNTSTASTSADNTVAWNGVVDNVAPTVTVEKAAGQTDPTNTGPIVYTVTFSEPVTGFDATDVKFAGSTAGGPLVAEVTGGSTVYTVTVTGMNATGNVVMNLLAGAATDAANNTSTASTSVDNTVAYTHIADNVAPTVTVEKAAGQTDPTNTGPIVYTVTFSEPVTGFDATDVKFAGSTAGGPLVAEVTGGSTVYTVTVTGMNATGNVVMNLLAGAATDAANNTSTASTSLDNTVAYARIGDNVAPTVAVTKASGQADTTTNGPINYTVTFSEDITGFELSDISFAGSTAGGTLP